MTKRFDLKETTLICEQIAKSIKTENTEEKRWLLEQWRALKTHLEKTENKQDNL